MKLFSHTSMRAGAVAAGLLAAGAAQAHTGHGTAGIAAGLMHPLGADHLLAMVAVGIWSVSALPVNKAWWGPAAFMLSLVVGAALGAMGMSLPLLEQSIALSVVLLGMMLVLSRRNMPLPVGLGIVAMVASMHGLAHGSETPATGFATYAVGFLVTTAALHFGGVLAGLHIRRHLARQTTWVVGGLGTAFGAAGLYLFGQF